MLELYSLESELARVQARIGQLEERSATVRSRQEAARDHLAVVRAALAEAERRLGERLRQLYVEGEADPLEVLLGAESLGDALSTLDNLGRFAQQDRTIIGDVERGRAELRDALDRLAQESAAVDALLAEAEQARAALLAKRADKATYLDRVRREERLNEQQLADALAVADAAEQKSQELTSGDGGSGSGGAALPLLRPPRPDRRWADDHRRGDGLLPEGHDRDGRARRLGRGRGRPGRHPARHPHDDPGLRRRRRRGHGQRRPRADHRPLVPHHRPGARVGPPDGHDHHSLDAWRASLVAVRWASAARRYSAS